MSSVQYNGGLLPDILLLTLCDYTGGPFRYHEELLSLQPMFPPKPFYTFFPSRVDAQNDEGLDAFNFLFKLLCATRGFTDNAVDKIL